MGEEAEVSLLEATTPELEVRGMSFEAWRKEFSVRLRRAADRVRQAYCRQTEDGAVAEATISTRVLLRFRDLLLLSYRSPAMKNEPRAALRRAMKIALTDCLEDAGALAVEKLVELEIGDIGILPSCCFLTDRSFFNPEMISVISTHRYSRAIEALG